MPLQFFSGKGNQNYKKSSFKRVDGRKSSGVLPQDYLSRKIRSRKFKGGERRRQEKVV